MQIIDYNNNGVTLSFSTGELVFLKNILNEILHGLKIENFEIRIGQTYASTDLLLNEIKQCR